MEKKILNPILNRISYIIYLRFCILCIICSSSDCDHSHYVVRKKLTGIMIIAVVSNCTPLVYTYYGVVDTKVGRENSCKPAKLMPNAFHSGYTADNSAVVVANGNKFQ